MSGCLPTTMMLGQSTGCHSSWPQHVGVVVRHDHERDGLKQFKNTKLNPSKSTTSFVIWIQIPQSHLHHFASNKLVFCCAKEHIQLPRDLTEITEFQDLPQKPLEELAALMKLRLYLPQQVILQQGTAQRSHNGNTRVEPQEKEAGRTGKCGSTSCVFREVLDHF